MNTLRLLRIWNRLKRQLRSILIRVGTGKEVIWTDEFREFMEILTAVADVQDEMERKGQTTTDSDPIDPEPTTDSPYDDLVPKAEPPKQKRRLFRRR